MAGRMGGDRITIKNLEVVGIDNANNQLLIKGLFLVVEEHWWK
jgi:ribosomal protein L3